MTVTLTHDTALNRVAIDCDDLASTDQALVERSTDQVRWTTVRGGAAWPVSGGEFTRTLHDDEFAPDVPNYYRVRALVPTTGRVFVGVSTADTGAQGTRGALLPAGIAKGDTIYALASTRNSGTGTVNTPTDWTTLVASGNVSLIGRIWDGVWSAPAVTFTSGASNEDTIEQMWAFRGPGLNVHNSAAQLNGSAQNIALPALAIAQANCTLFQLGWKADDWSGVAALAGLTEIQEAVSTAGNDAGQVADFGYQTTPADVGATSFVVTGGAGAISRGLVVALSLRDYLHEQTANLTPVLTSHWLKSIARPFLNMPVAVGKRRDRRYASRGTTLDVINRSDAVEITDLRGGPEFDLIVRTADRAERERLKNLLAGGDVLLLQAPVGSQYETCYVAVGDVTQGILGWSTRERWTLPCGRRAAPESDVVGVTSTCDTILNDFATCDTILNDFATCVEVMEYVADPSDVIVP